MIFVLFGQDAKSLNPQLSNVMMVIIGTVMIMLEDVC